MQDAFERLRAVGEASNAGNGGDEALRQACAVVQEQGASVVDALIDGRFDDSGRGENDSFSITGLRGKLLEQGRSGFAQALSSACAALRGESAGSGFDPEQLKTMGIALALDESEQVLRNIAAPYVKRLELETGYEDGEFTWQALTVVPLWKDDAEQNHLFTQLSWNRTVDDGDTYNAGMAWRRLNEEKTLVYGVNAFVDHGAKMNHNRASVGADAQTSQLGISTNYYWPLSDWKSLDVYEEERAASGWDLELQGRIPDLPSWQASLKGYQWSANEKGEAGNVYGYDAAVQWTPINIMEVEAGIRDEQESDPDIHATVRLVYRFGDSIGFATDRPQRLASVEERVYDKVRRENKIRTERRTKDSAYVTVSETSGANSALLASGAAVGLSAGQELPRPFTLNVSPAPGSVARLRFRDGAILTAGAGTSVRVEAATITLLAGEFHFVSGSQNVVINVPGGTVTLLGTDIDASTDGTTSTVRVRDGAVRYDGAASGSATLAAGQAASSVSGVVGAPLATNDPAFIAHADRINTEIDRAASPLTGDKIAPYNSGAPRIVTPATAPGQGLVIGLPFNTAVTSAGGPPRLMLTVNGTPRQANLTGGSGTAELLFTYTLQPGENGASTVIVTAFDLNGGTITGNGRNAVTTIADANLVAAGPGGDINAPSGYAVAFTTDPVTASNHAAAAIQITGAEVNATYNYSISSSGGGTAVTGTGTIATATQSLSAIDVSGLGDGTLTVSLTLTDPGNNTGAPATDTVTKNTLYLGLNFTGGQYSLNGTSYASPNLIPGWSFTRAAPATTYAEDSSGNLVSFAANQPRITDKGLLIEESRTNYATFPPDGTGWRADATSTGSVGTSSDSSIIGKDGRPAAVYAWVGASSSGNSGRAVSDNIAVTASQSVVLDVYLAGANGDTTTSIGIYSSVTGWGANGNNLASLISGPGSLSRATGGLWVLTGLSQTQLTRVRIVRSATTTENMRVLWYPKDSGTIGAAGASGVISMPQFELGAFSTSYIPTTTAAVTRSADNVTISGLSVFPAYTVFAEFENPVTPSTTARLIAFDATGGRNSVTPLVRTTQAVSAFNTLDSNTPLATGLVQSVRRVAGVSTTSPQSRRVVADGQSVVGDAGMTPMTSTIHIGSQFNNNSVMNTYMRAARLYPSAHADAALQAATAP